LFSTNRSIYRVQAVQANSDVDVLDLARSRRDRALQLLDATQSQLLHDGE